MKTFEVTSLETLVNRHIFYIEANSEQEARRILEEKFSNPYDFDNRMPEKSERVVAYEDIESIFETDEHGILLHLH